MRIITQNLHCHIPWHEKKYEFLKEMKALSV